MAILVTRSGERGIQLTEALSLAGVAALHLPLFDVIEGSELNLLPQKLNTLQKGDMVIAVSPYAVSYASAVLKNVGLTWRSDLHYFAVGRKTAVDFSHTIEQKVHYPALNECSEGLLAMIDSMQLSPQKALILKGDKGRELLQKTMQEKGIEVENVVCYQRQELSAELLPADVYIRAGIEAIIVTSGDILAYLLDFIPKNEHNWLISCKLIVISSRIALLAQQYGWQKSDIIIADKADNATLLNTALQLINH